MPGTTPVYGFPYPEPTDLVADYPALGQDLAEDIEAVLPTLGGLAPVAPTSIANSGGTATLSNNTVTFTGVSSVSLNGCFTATYNAYKIITIVTAVSGTDVQLYARMRLAGTDATGNYSDLYTYSYSNSTAGGSYNGAAAGLGVGYYSTGQAIMGQSSMEMYSPATAKETLTTCNYLHYTSTANRYNNLSMSAHNVDTAYDGMSLIIGSGTVTGTVSIYGFRK